MFNLFYSAPLKTKKLRLNIHWFFKLQFSLYGLAIASLAQVIQTPDSKPHWTRRAENYHCTADHAYVFVPKQLSETHDFL